MQHVHKLLVFLLILFLPVCVLAVSVNLTFVNPTPLNMTITQNNSHLMNVSILNSTMMKSFTYSWNNTNYSWYNNNLILFLNFNNITAIGENSTIVKDISPYKRNNVTIMTLINQSSNGKYDWGIEFLNRTQSVIRIPSFWLPTKNQTTFVAWVYVKDPQYGTLFSDASQGNKTGNGYFWIRKTNAAAYSFEYNNATATYGRSVSWASIFTANTWVHTVLVVDADAQQAYFYKDGVYQGNRSTPNIQKFNTTGKTVYIGDYAANHVNNLTAILDDVMIFNTSLTQDQITNIYMSSMSKRLNDTFDYNINQTNITGDQTTYKYFVSATDNDSISYNSGDYYLISGGQCFCAPGADWIITNTVCTITQNCNLGGFNLILNRVNFTVSNAFIIVKNFTKFNTTHVLKISGAKITK